MDTSAIRYAELQVTTNFSFLRGASHPEALVRTAQSYGHQAIAITDRNTMAGVVRAHVMAKELGMRLVVGARLDFVDSPSVLCFPRDRAAYGRLTTLLTIGKRRAEKGHCTLYSDDLFAHSAGQIIVVLPPDDPDDSFIDHLRVLKYALDTVYLALSYLYRGDDVARLNSLAALAGRLKIPAVATNDVHYHDRDRRPLQDVLTCIRAGCTIHDAGYRLFANAERHLKPRAEMARLFENYPEALANTVEIAEAAQFSIEDLKYEYPEEPIEGGLTPQEELTRLVWEGADRQYPHGVSEKIKTQLLKELDLIAARGFAQYFLTIRDIMEFARSQDILCQGRGSAANSAVCYMLRITQIDPTRHELLFERFLSTARHEPPDIDVDFEHDRREEVIRYIYDKYTKERAGLVATVIRYQPRSALRDVGKALGMSMDIINVLSKSVWSWGRGSFEEPYLREAGLDPGDPALQQVISLTLQLIGAPRHLSQHVGGFVITKGPLYELVPIENAAMDGRTVIEWDKDDIDTVGIFKIDVLALGMLTCLHKCFDLLAGHYGRRLTIDTVPGRDEKTYDMLCKADTIGVFQVESRAQMSMLPRLKPREFYDLVVEVAIVRPGPIQGGMVHPYLKRRNVPDDQIEYPSEELRAVLCRTKGVPLFQEQAMQIAMVAAGFSAADADKLRRSMATFKRSGTIKKLEADFINGMLERKYPLKFAQSCFRQIEGFAEYGFPESHAASFALLVYVSAWMKCHYPALFTAAMLNSQPMGFYAPAQLIRDLRDHEVEVRPVDVSHSYWDCTLERNGDQHALRLGFRQVKGLSEKKARQLVDRRGDGYSTLRDTWRRSGLYTADLEALANADAWGSLGLGRREALWEIRGLSEASLPLLTFAETNVPFGHNRPPAEQGDEPAVSLPAMTLGEQVVEDYRHLGFSLKCHPMTFLRDRFAARGAVPSSTLATLQDGEPVVVGGIVLVRQQPGTAKGVIFVTLEDEAGIANIVVWERVFDEYRRALLGSRLMVVKGKVQREGIVIHVVAEKLIDRSEDLKLLSQHDGKFEQAMARADGVRRPGRDPRDAIPEGRNFH